MTASTALPTLALWYQRSKSHRVREKRPIVELHINLWRRADRRSKDSDVNYLDVGLRIIEPRDLGAINLYVPFPCEMCEVEDLGGLLREKEIASAVFNEVLEVCPEDGNDALFYLEHAGKHSLTVHVIDIENDTEIISDPSAAPNSGFVLRFKRDFCARLNTPGEHYFRFRFKLKPIAAKIFSSDVSNEDGWILSYITTSEISEIRINEARSIPDRIIRLSSEHNWIAPHVSAIHYFLVRDINFDLIASHASFRKIRRMEPEWDRYLGEEFAPGSARKMLIYHWRKMSGGDDVGDFVTLAKFRRSKNNILTYISAVVALGAIGSGTHSSLDQLLRCAARWLQWPTMTTGGTTTWTATFMLIVIFFAVIALQRRLRR